jgi:hypothetical protein
MALTAPGRIETPYGKELREAMRVLHARAAAFS